mmetsp:Transcript_111275/g.197051  ORF Transcript_111275/g.197051 Transcript_111275/m.197051 type:complete len:538 (-) Transcript_111275:132-1745(-)
MASLLANCEEVDQMYAEIDHLIAFAGQSWAQRTGGVGTRDPLVQPKNVCITVGLELPLAAGPKASGGANTPPKSPLHSGRYNSSRAGSRGKATSKFRQSSVRNAWSERRSRVEDEGDLPSHRIYKGPMVSQTGNALQDFVLPDFLIAESPTLFDMHRASHGQQELGPVKRQSKLFSAVVALMKLRWLIRLHNALTSFAGMRCSLQRLLVGVLADTCGVHTYPHSPLQVYELVLGTLQSRFVQSWPLLIAYISTHDPGLFGSESRSESRLQTALSRPHTSPASTGFKPPPAWANSSRASIAALVAREAAREASEAAAFLWQVVDDIFIAWLVQEDPSKMPAEAVMQELDYFGITRPVVRTNLEGLRSWHVSKQASSRLKHVRPAQRQAHHLALLLELPNMRDDLSGVEEIVDLARDVVSHPRTFNMGLRARVACVIQGGSQLLGYLEADHIKLDEDQMSQYLSHSADARDNGRIKPIVIEQLRDMGAPWLVGRVSRFNAAARAWPDRAPKPDLVLEAMEKAQRPNTVPGGVKLPRGLR